MRRFLTICIGCHEMHIFECSELVFTWKQQHNYRIARADLADQNCPDPQ